MTDKSSINLKGQDDARILLTRAPVICGACELDLLRFLHRHPRALLTSEQIATFVGYDMKQVAKSIEVFIEAGLLGRTKNRLHAARMYSLILNGRQGDELAAVLEMASTKQGRSNLLALLCPGAAPEAALTRP